MLNKITNFAMNNVDLNVDNDYNVIKNTNCNIKPIKVIVAINLFSKN